MVQRHITCEGRYTITLMYHMIFLLHFTGERRMSLPFFLLNILTKMYARVQAHLENTKYSVIHQDLIKLLIMEELNKTQRTWQYFLVGFKEETHDP
jgi:hypothetical protein